MTAIRIQSATQTWTADTTEGARVFRVGRDEASDIVATDPTVSRRHAEIRALGEGWEVVDLGSSLGTWVNGQRVERAALQGTVAIGFGEQGRAFGVTVTVTPATPPVTPSMNPPAAPATRAVAPGSFPPPYAAPPAPVAPAAGFTPSPVLGQTMITGPGGPGGLPGFGGPGLLVRRRVGGDLRFPGGIPVRIGRDPSLEVHADDQAVSRLHAVVEPRPDGWWWTDRSTSGSFVEGEQVTSFRIEEPVEISLGHPTAGYEIEVVPVVAAGEASAAIARKKRRRTLAVVGGVVGALVLVGGGVTTALVVGDDDEPAPRAGAPEDPSPQSPSQTPLDPEAQRAAALDRAKAATVLLQAFDESGQGLWSGSGSIISETGLVLTNAHVGDPNAPGQGSDEPDPAYLTVSLTSGDDDEPAAAAYRARPIVSDGYLDVAVLQIVADVDGDPVDPADLELPEPLPIGDSDELRTGDRIIALGYPSIGNVVAQGDRPLTVTEGVVSTFQADPVVGTDRGSIDSDVRLGSGNSGGPSIDQDGEIIGLNTRVITAASMDAGAITQGSALIVPVNLAEEVLAIAEDGGDPSYVSPYVSDMPSDPGVPPQARVTAAGWVPEGDQGECAGTSSPEDPQVLRAGVGDALYAEFLVEGVPDGLPFSIDFYTPDGTRVDTIAEAWSFGEQAVCIFAPLTIQADVPGITAVFFLGQGGEFAAENPLAFR